MQCKHEWVEIGKTFSPDGTVYKVYRCNICKTIKNDKNSYTFLDRLKKYLQSLFNI